MRLISQKNVLLRVSIESLSKEELQASQGSFTIMVLFEVIAVNTILVMGRISYTNCNVGNSIMIIRLVTF